MVAKHLLYNANIITMDEKRRQYSNGAILIEDDHIIKIGTSDKLTQDLSDDIESIDLEGRWILPGFINTHVHTSQQLGRGLADDVDLLTWLRGRIWPYESNLTLEDSYVSSLLCGIEQIRSGVTAFAEAGGQHVEGMVRAVSELGIRATLTKSCMDMGEGLPKVWQLSTQELLDIQVSHYEKWHNSAEGRIRIWFGLRTIFNNSDDLIVRSKALADEYGVSVHMHMAEIPEENDYSRATRGTSTVTHLNNLGVLDSNLLAVHCVWMTDEEILMFADHDVKVSHNPAAAMKVLGFAKIPEMIDAGICVTIGTDGAPANNRMTLIDEMWLTSLIHKGRLRDPQTMPAETVLAMATSEGSKALGWEDEIGSLEVGKKADLIVINPNTATMLPMHDGVASMVYALRQHNVESVMVNGKWVMWEQVIQTVNEAEILEEAKERASAIFERTGIQLPNRFNVI